MRKFSKMVMALSGAILLSACSWADADETAQTFDTDLGKVVVTQKISSLENPWGMEMLPNGNLIITERDGTIWIIDPDNQSDRQQVANVPSVWAYGQGGLLDIAVDPDFENNNTIYFTFSEPDASDDNAGTALASATLNLDGKPKLENVKPLYSMEPKTSAGQHFGSRIVFGKDGNLFFTIGDRGRQPRAQDTKDPAGSVIRIAKDGSIPKDNPFVNQDDTLSEIWSIGHRNPQGAARHPETGELWTLAHGAKGGDEINRPEAGKNYGWPKISYGTNYSGAPFELGSSAPGLEQPKYYWDPSIAPSGLDFYTGDAIPQWKGNLFAGALKYQLLVRLEMDGDRIVKEERLFPKVYGRIREVRSFPDGALWFMNGSSDGAIYRISQ